MLIEYYAAEGVSLRGAAPALPGIAYTETVVSGTIVRSIHWQAVRNAVKMRSCR